MEEKLSEIKKMLGDVGLAAADSEAEQFLKFYEILIEKNKVMNLTAITEFGEVLIKHFADSLSLSSYVNLSEIKNMLDLGTGAGFPGVPIKIMFPNISVTYLDSLAKRMNYLTDACTEIGMENFECVHGRAEDFGRDKNFREKYELVVSRAVANLSVLAEYALPFVEVGGMFVSYKSANSEEEINNSKKAIKELGGKIEKVETFTLPGSEDPRSLVFIRKEKKTPSAYPRKAGIPKKSPIE